MVFASCSTDVDLYADYQEIPVVFGLIDAQADTNYIKITKAFCGTNDNPVNALEAALVYDSSNYAGKLDAYFVELKSVHDQPFEPTGRQFYLDTLTIHDKKEGLFYAPDQLMYYTTARFNTNTDDEKYRYKLCVIKPDFDTVTAETSIVGGDVHVFATQVTFSPPPYLSESRMMFCSTEEAVLYEIGMRFYYWESHPGEPMVKKQVSWSYRPRSLAEYEKVEGSDKYYWFYFTNTTLFNYLERAIGDDIVYDANHPNVTRYIDDFEVFIAATGRDFYAYYQYLQTTQNGLNLSTEYNNIEGGCGLLSSRILVTNVVPLSPSTRLDLFNQPWGFRERKTR